MKHNWDITLFKVIPRWFGGSEVKAFACNAGDLGLIPGSGKIPWRRKWQPTPVFLPGESHGWRSLVGYSRGVAESWTWRSDFTFLSTFLFLSVTGTEKGALRGQPWNWMSGQRLAPPSGQIKKCKQEKWEGFVERWEENQDWVLSIYQDQAVDFTWIISFKFYNYLVA